MVKGIFSFFIGMILLLGTISPVSAVSEESHMRDKQRLVNLHLRLSTLNEEMEEQLLLQKQASGNLRQEHIQHIEELVRESRALTSDIKALEKRVRYQFHNKINDLSFSPVATQDVDNLAIELSINMQLESIKNLVLRQYPLPKKKIKQLRQSRVPASQHFEDQVEMPFDNKLHIGPTKTKNQRN